RESPLQSGTNVVLLGIDPLQPALALAGPELRLCRFRKPREQIEVPAADWAHLVRLEQTVARIPAHRLEQPIPGWGALIQDDQRLLDESLQQVQDLGVRYALIGTDCLRCFQGPTAGEHGQ